MAVRAKNAEIRTITGNLSGNATSATTATNDTKGQAITSYIRALSISGRTITYTKGDGTTGTITTQDTNTTYTLAGLVGSTAIGSTTHPIYWDGSKFTTIGYTIAKSVPSNAVFTDTHYTTGLKVGASATATANAAASNGSVYLNALDNTTVRDSHLIKGSGATTVTSDANGVITISSTDTNTNTTYSAGTGLSLSGTTFNHSNSVTAGTAQGDASKTLTFGGTFTIPTVTYDAQGHITAKGTTTMTMPANPNTDTHYTTHLYAGTSSGAANASTTNGNTHLILTDNTTVRNRVKIAGSGATTVTSDANGNITISSTDTNTNTTYSAGTGLSLSGTTFNHKNSVTAATAQGDASKTLTFGGTFTIPTVTYDAQGHITAKGTTTMTMPANPNTDTKVSNTLANTTKAYITGTTTASTNTGTQVFDSGVYITATAGQLNATSYKVAEKVNLQYNSTNECLDFVFG